MILRVNPNRMELLRLRKRLVLAQRGHKLLQDKLEEMMRRFLVLLKDIDQAKEDFQKRNQTLVGDLLYCRITSSKEDFERSLSQIKSKIAIGISATRILNVKVPVFAIDKLEIEKEYDFFKTSAQMDLVVGGAKGYIQSLLKLAQLFKTLDILSYEIERTRRRVNALEYKLIPSIQETIRYITQKLNEFERSNLVRLMRVTEIVRSH
jgi:V/A-type H+-transporting ATPase subunit D